MRVVNVLLNVIWLVFGGLFLALGYALSAIGQFVTIVGIPLGLANLKLVPVSLFPLGHEIVDGGDIRQRGYTVR